MRKLFIDSTEVYTSHKRRPAWRDIALEVLVIGVLWPLLIIGILYIAL